MIAHSLRIFDTNTDNCGQINSKPVSSIWIIATRNLFLFIIILDGLASQQYMIDTTLYW